MEIIPLIQYGGHFATGDGDETGEDEGGTGVERGILET